MRKNSNKIGMYRIIILSYMYLECCSLPEKKDEIGVHVLAIFFFSPSSWTNLLFLDGMFACLLTRFVIRMKNLKITVWETIFFKHSPKWRVDWNKYSPKWNKACHIWRVTFFLNSPTICNKYQINNTVMFNNLFCTFWQVINLVKKDQHSLKSCVDLFFLNFKFRCLRLLSCTARYKTCMSNPIPTHI